MKLNSVKKILKDNIKVIRQINKIDKSRVFMTSLYWVCDMIEIVIYNILLLPFLYYAIDHSLRLGYLFIIEGVLTAVLIFCDVFQSFYNVTYTDKSNQKMTHKFFKKMYSHIRNDDLEKLYDPSGLDTLMRLLNLGIYNLTSALDMQWWAISVLVLGAIYVSVLIKIDVFLIIVAILSSVFMLFINLKLNKLNYQNMVEGSAISRKLQYVTNIFSLRDYSQDLRATGLKGLMFNYLHKVTIETNNRINTTVRKICKYSYIKSLVIFCITTSVTWIYLAIKYLLLRSLTLGVTDIIVAQTMMQQLCNLLIDVSNIGPGLQRNSMYIDEYFQYIESEPKIKANENGIKPEKKANEIRIRNVSFSYDGENPILKDISMNISAGEKIAIVGKNGAGKSTIVKLLLRLYKPDTGDIEMDGITVDSYKLIEYRERFGVAFQNTKQYATTVAENVLMRPFDVSDKALVSNALKNSKLFERVEEESKGIDSIVTKEFDADGIEFSGGQAQKLALSRVFARDSGVVILDEPSASLDPISEAEMYESMLDLMNDKTVILISHRLSACKKVDKIYVIDDGIIAEEGTHAELLQKGGLYAEMWQLQASGYSESL